MQRDEITGKQKMVPMDEAELNEVMDGGKKTSKDEASKSGAVEMPRGLGAGCASPSREGDSSANDDAGSSKKMPARVDEVKDEVLEVLETIGETSGAIGDDGKSGARDASSSFHRLVVFVHDADSAAYGDVPRTDRRESRGFAHVQRERETIFRRVPIAAHSRDAVVVLRHRGFEPEVWAPAHWADFRARLDAVDIRPVPASRHDAFLSYSAAHEIRGGETLESKTRVPRTRRSSRRRR